MGLRRKTSIISALVLLWLVFVVGGYFVYHKPFTPDQLSVWLKAGYQTTIGLLIISCAGGLGLRILNSYYPDQSHSIVQCTGLGLGILGTTYLGVGWIVGIRWYWSFLLVGSLTVWCWRAIFQWLKGLLHQIQDIMPDSRYSIILAALIGVLVLAGWLVAASPPIAFDALVYHLSLPITYLQAGKYVYVPTNTYWGMPQLGEMLYTLAISVGGVEAGPILGWMIGFFSLVGIGEVLKESLSRDEIWVALAALLCGFTFTDSLSWGYVDWIAFFWGICVIRAFYDHLQKSQQGSILLGGIFCGFALGTKYTAGILVLAAVLAIFCLPPKPLVIGWDERRRSQFFLSNIRLLVTFALVCVLTSLPWWFKNLLAVGQPFYPLLFPAGEMSSSRINFYSGLEPYGKWWISFLLPITSTMIGVEGKEGFSASIGPLFLLLSPFSICLLSEQINKEKQLIRLSILFAVTGWITWGIGARLAGYLIQSRLYWAIFPSLVIMSGFGYRKLTSLQLGKIRVRFVLNSMILFLLTLTAVEIFSSLIHKKVLDLMSGQIDSQTYLTHNLGWHYLALQEIQKPDKQSRTLLLFEPRSLYCLPNCDGDELLDEWYIASRDSSMRIEDILLHWKERGYQYVLIFHQGAEFVHQNDRRYQKSQWELFEQLVSLLSVEQIFGGAYRLYQLP